MVIFIVNCHHQDLSRKVFFVPMMQPTGMPMMQPIYDFCVPMMKATGMPMPLVMGMPMTVCTGTSTIGKHAPRSAVVVSYGARAHDMDAAHPVGPTSGTWAKIRPPGAAKGPQKGLSGPKWALLGSPGVL